MRKIKFLISLFIFYSVLAMADPNTIYQAGTFMSLTNGVLDGSTTLAELVQKGDFGLGTTNGINGEMVILNGQAYLSNNAGQAKLISLNNKTPFALVTHFKPDQEFILNHIDSIASLGKAIDAYLPSKNDYYAIRIIGKFKSIKFRALDPQHRPYVSYLEWAKTHEHIFYVHHINATIVAFKTPIFAKDLSTAGYHLHFITDDKKIVGHVYDLSFDTANIAVETIKNFNLVLPNTADFKEASLS